VNWGNGAPGNSLIITALLALFMPLATMQRNHPENLFLGVQLQNLLLPSDDRDNIAHYGNFGTACGLKPWTCSPPPP
jgi:hypothetical protein